MLWIQAPEKSTQSIPEDTACHPAGLQACYRLFLKPFTPKSSHKCSILQMPFCRCSSHHSAALQQEDNVAACLHILPLRGNIQLDSLKALSLLSAELFHYQRKSESKLFEYHKVRILQLFCVCRGSYFNGSLKLF